MLALVAHLLSLAVLFLLLRAEFVAAVQVVVYAGAVMVLYVFVVAYVGGESDSIGERLRGAPAPSRLAACASAARSLGGALLVELLIALLGTGLEAIKRLRRRLRARAADVRHPGLHRQPAAHALPARVRDRLVPAADRRRRRRRARPPPRRPGRGDERDVLTPLDLLRPRGTGTTAEGVGRLRNRATASRGDAGAASGIEDG